MNPCYLLEQQTSSKKNFPYIHEKVESVSFLWLQLQTQTKPELDNVKTEWHGKDSWKIKNKIQERLSIDQHQTFKLKIE